jgi:hypothetical protein
MGAPYFENGEGMDRPAEWPYIVPALDGRFAKLNLGFAKPPPKKPIYQRLSWGMVKWYPIGLRDNPL